MIIIYLALFGASALELLLDWWLRGKDFVSASRVNYIFKALIGVILITIVGCYYLVSHHPILWWLAVPLVAIMVSKYRNVFVAMRVLLGTIDNLLLIPGIPEPNRGTVSSRYPRRCERLPANRSTINPHQARSIVDISAVRAAATSASESWCFRLFRMSVLHPLFRRFLARVLLVRQALPVRFRYVLQRRQAR
jgi:hypothetical protein